MNPTLNINSTGSVLAVDKALAIVARQNEFKKSVTGVKNLSGIWPSVWHRAKLLEGFAGVLAVLYSFAALALSAELLFYTFSR